MKKIGCAASVLLATQLACAETTHIYVSGALQGRRIANFLPTADDLKALCEAVGEDGRVYAITIPSVPEQRIAECGNVVSLTLKSKNIPAPELHSDSDDPGWVYEYYSMRPAIENIAAPEPLDLIWISEPYGKLNSKEHGSPNIRSMNEALLAVLKQGGELIVVERAAGARAAKVLIVSAGFEFIDERKRGAELLLRFRRRK